MSKKTKKLDLSRLERAIFTAAARFFPLTMAYQNIYKYLYSLLKRRGQIENKSAALCYLIPIELGYGKKIS